MREIRKENTKFFRNGNWWPGMRRDEGTVEMVRYFGTQKVYEMKACINYTDKILILKSGYDTTANGCCDDLILEPGEGIIQTGPGSPESFACYRVFKVS